MLRGLKQLPCENYDLKKESASVKNLACLAGGNRLDPKIKVWILICCPYSFPTEVVGRGW